MTFKTFSSVVIGSLISLSCSSSEPITWENVETLISNTFPNITHISTSELSSLLENGDMPIVILDAREHAEYSVSHLQSAHHISMNLDAALKILNTQPTAMAVAYCSVGYRSAQLASLIQQAGHENVFNLEGSIFKWTREGRPVFRDGKPVNVVHPFNENWGALLPEKFWSYDTSENSL